MLKVVIEKRKDFYFPLADKHFLGGEYQEPHRTNSLSFVDNFGVAMDIGAHVGTWAVDLVQKFDKVICFEPILEHRICLEKNLEKFSKDKYEIYSCALGNEEGVVQLSYADQGNSGTASIVGDDGGDYAAHIKTLDSFEFPQIDYLKVDIEGFELQFLKGAAETIKRTKPVINIEIKNTCERFGTTQEQIISFIENELNMELAGTTVADHVFISR